MSTTATTTTKTTLVGALPPMTGTVVVASGVHCPHCGQDVPVSTDQTNEEARRRIQELESQVKFLTARQEQTAEKLADYEDEINVLRSQTPAYSQKNSSISSTSSAPAAVLGPPSVAGTTSTLASSAPEFLPQQPQTSRLSSFTSFLPYRRNIATSAGPNTASSNHAHSNSELQDALSREQNLRKAAESRLSQANSELEELTAQLFSQANEMVAEERKARAKLEERVEILERRDGEKRKRLDRLEKAIERVERVRGLVGMK
ncbi:hypothetical protein Plec18167_005299 [Paecilomyces lecythidis]|uniref:GDP/GTP exchange factor Sec2 N-terminal domain-containing protein n=1 Tax=Paecilomyces lecythidis TaxID=3004212 RepID=A0ABR3XJE0_9EURO